MRADSKIELARSLIGMVVRADAAKPDIGSVEAFRSTQVSELIHIPGISFVGTIPAEIQPTIFFAAALTTDAREPEAAGALIRFLASSEAAPAIAKAGLPLPER